MPVTMRHVSKLLNIQSDLSLIPFREPVHCLIAWPTKKS